MLAHILILFSTSILVKSMDNGGSGYLIQNINGNWVEPLSRSLSAYAEPHIANFYRRMVRLMLLVTLKEK